MEVGSRITSGASRKSSGCLDDWIIRLDRYYRDCCLLGLALTMDTEEDAEKSTPEVVASLVCSSCRRDYVLECLCVAFFYSLNETETDKTGHSCGCALGSPRFG